MKLLYSRKNLIVPGKKYETIYAYACILHYSNHCPSPSPGWVRTITGGSSHHDRHGSNSHRRHVDENTHPHSNLHVDLHTHTHVYFHTHVHFHVHTNANSHHHLHANYHTLPHL